VKSACCSILVAASTSRSNAGGESAEGQGPFLAPVGPINQEATSFTATLTQLDSVQTPDEYEGEKGERLQAIPTGRRGTNKFVPTGVEAAFTVHTNVPVDIKGVTAGEIEAQQHEEEATKQEAALQKLQATLKKLEEALKKAEEHAKQVGEEAKKHEEELNAQIAAIKKHQEEEAAAKKEQEEKEKAKSQPPTRAQLLARALRACEKQPKKGRARCVASAHRQYGVRAKK
jgi:Skp family chaperone for outer membrane proteins